MSLSATRFPLPHVGTAGNQGSDPATCADPQVGGLLWGSQSGYRPVRTNDMPDLQRYDVPNLPPATAAPTHARAPHDRRARQRSLSSRQTPYRLPSSPCAPVALAVSSALQPATGSDRTGLETHSAPCYSQPLLRHTGRSAEGRQRLLRSLAKTQQDTASTMLHYLRRRV
jgi:hypothetical protein